MDTKTNLNDYVQEWTLGGLLPLGCSDDSDESFEDLLQQINFMTDHAYARYVPALFSKHSPVFQDRMIRWMQNTGLTELDRIALFQFVTRLAYYSFDDFLGLYRTAFSGPISRWIWKQCGLNLDQVGWNDKLATERDRHTWYIAATDSMLISEFYHANSISGIKHRPHLLSLTQFADVNKVNDYMQQNDLRRIVLLEDFVGSGQQTLGLVQAALQSIPVPLLFCPMLICPDGHGRMAQLARTTPNDQFTILPVILLGDSVFMSSHDGADPVLNHMSTLSQRIHSEVQGTAPPGGPPYSHNGYHLPGDAAVGATVVLFSNTPDNTLPLVHFDSSRSNWKPIFPRVSREVP